MNNLCLFQAHHSIESQNRTMKCYPAFCPGISAIPSTAAGVLLSVLFTENCEGRNA
jgi:hypothetical protein